MAAELAILISGKNTASKAFNEASKAAGGFGKMLTDVSKIAAGFVIGSAITQLPKLFDGPIKAASDLGESMNAVQVVFGKTSDKIIEFGNVSAKQAGLSRRAFNQLATPLGAMLKNAGFSMDQVADKTVELTKRAADMASVFNTDVDQALGAVTAALRGETDPIERYGVSVNAAKVEVEALAMTGKKNASALTDQEKAAARLSLIMKQTSSVAGDFVNTSDGLANKQRILAARTEEVSAQLGERMMPIMLKVKEVQLALVEAFTTRMLPALISIGETAAPIATAAFERIRGAASDLIGAITPLIALFKLGFNGGEIGGQFSAIERAAFTMGNTLKTVVLPAIGDVKEGFRLFMLTLQGGEVGGDIGGFAQRMADLGVGVRDAWNNGLQPALTAIKDFLVNDFYPAFKTGAGSTLDAFKVAIETIGPLLKDVFNFVINNETAMTVAIAAIGTAIVLALGPASQAAIALAGIMYTIGKVKELLDEIDRRTSAGERSPTHGNFLGNLPIIGGTLENAINQLPGRRASGGPVSAGRPYIVGERGPELMVPGRSGTIVPNGGGPSVVQVNVMLDNRVLGKAMVDLKNGGALRGSFA